MSNDADGYSEDQVRRFDRDRWLTTLFAPRPARASLLALYAFNVEVARIRELVREPAAGFIRLQWWRDTIAEIAAGQPRQHPVALALAAAWRRHALSLELFESVLAARELDLGNEPPETLAALETYAAGSSGALTRLALTALGADGEAAAQAGQHVGIAWALTGLLRAVPFHAAERRLFLPRDLVEGQGVELEALFHGRPGSGLTKVAAAIAQRAADHLASARSLRATVPRSAHPALLPATIADLHLRRLAQVGFALFEPRLQRPIGSTAARLAAASWLRRY